MRIKKNLKKKQFLKKMKSCMLKDKEEINNYRNKFKLNNPKNFNKSVLLNQTKIKLNIPVNSSNFSIQKNMINGINRRKKSQTNPICFKKIQCEFKPNISLLIDNQMCNNFPNNKTLVSKGIKRKLENDGNCFISKNTSICDNIINNVPEKYSKKKPKVDRNLRKTLKPKKHKHHNSNNEMFKYEIFKEQIENLPRISFKEKKKDDDNRLKLKGKRNTMSKLISKKRKHLYNNYNITKKILSDIKNLDKIKFIES